MEMLARPILLHPSWIKYDMISLQMMTFKWKRFVFTKCLYTFSTMCTVVFQWKKTATTKKIIESSRKRNMINRQKAMVKRKTVSIQILTITAVNTMLSLSQAHIYYVHINIHYKNRLEYFSIMFFFLSSRMILIFALYFVIYSQNTWSTV